MSRRVSCRFFLRLLPVLAFAALPILSGCAGRDMSWDKESGSWSLPLETTDPSEETKRE